MALKNEYGDLISPYGPARRQTMGSRTDQKLKNSIAALEEEVAALKAQLEEKKGGKKKTAKKAATTGSGLDPKTKKQIKNVELPGDDHNAQD